MTPDSQDDQIDVMNHCIPGKLGPTIAVVASLVLARASLISWTLCKKPCWFHLITRLALRIIPTNLYNRSYLYFGSFIPFVKIYPFNIGFPTR